ncbi:uncharacterized protein LOC132187948 [Corylus avellana]|uniref:uncharacterized protein LOC132187948 n=1 Tax=Corylus avellana TaxID=13451 RepID=UPI00286C8975|nr:uncharacterized protein LOC132187948 [Corylus avellana]
MERCQLYDLGYRGPKFTWSNKREDGQFIMERLDRAIANQAWMNSFQNYCVEVLANQTSNHAPIYVQLHTAMRGQRRVKKRFFYEAGWGKQQSHSNIIQLVWRENNFFSNPWHSFLAKVERCKRVIKKWQVKEKGQAKQQIQKKTEQLKMLQMAETQPDGGENYHVAARSE